MADGKCSGTITPQRLSIFLHDAFNFSCHQGIHALLNFPVQVLATEIKDYFIDSHDFQ
jgi:hypothetical protein